MEKKTLFRVIEWVIAIAACVYLVYRLVNYDGYPALWAMLCAMDWRQWTAIILCVVLMPVNMSLEAWRWRTLVPMSWSEAHRQVYYSKLAGLITPWRLGEYPARALLMDKEQWTSVLSMGAVGSATMTAAIVLAGVMALAWTPAVFAYLGSSYLYSLAAVIVVLGAAYLLLPRALKKYVSVNHNLLLTSTAQSLVRLACWCVQLGLVLWAIDGQDGLIGLDRLIELGLKTPVYYLLVTITPNVPIAEAGVRGVWAIAVFGSVNAALAGVFLWVINTLLPCLIWPFFEKNAK